MLDLLKARMKLQTRSRIALETKAFAEFISASIV